MTFLCLVLIIGGGLYVLNNTKVGLNVKCRVLGDLEACVVEQLTPPNTVEQILRDVGNSI